MKSKKKLRLRKSITHPAVVMLFLIIVTILASGVFAFFETQATYNTVNNVTGQLESNLVSINNLFNYDGIKYMVSSAATNFASFTPLTSLFLSLIGVSVIQASGLLDALFKKEKYKFSNWTLTFILVFASTISSLINDIGYVLLIPLGALLFTNNKRNPVAAVVATFAAVSFGYGATIFVGSLDVSLIPYTTAAAKIIDPTAHVSLTSNLYIMIISSIILSLIGTTVVERKIVPKIGRVKTSKEEEFEEVIVIDEEEEEQLKLETEMYEKKGLKSATISLIIMIAIFIYSLLPNLPFSGILLDMNEKTYLRQLFGTNSYFQDGFTFLVTLLLVVVGISYGISSRKFKTFNEIVAKINENLQHVGELILLLFVASQFINIFKETNIGVVLTAWGSSLVTTLGFNGISLILLVLIVIMISTIFVPTPTLKWSILSASVVPALMQSNITPQFAQFILRAGDSITKGVTPLMAYFVIYLGYLNIYNTNKNRPITIKQAINYVTPYFIATTLTWVAIILIWFLIGLPIGPGVFATA